MRACTPTIVAAALVSLASPAGVDASPPTLRDVTTASGLDFEHVNGMSGRFHMVENMGAGVGLVDYDGDGDLDVYLPQGHPLDGVLPADAPQPTDRLFRNDGAAADGVPRFVDVTAAAGLAAHGYGMGVATGDVDGDGAIDLYVTNWGANQLLRNRGDGTFEDITAKSATGDTSWSVPAVFLDYDRDGDLDLFVGNYLAYSLDTLRECRSVTGMRDYCAPASYPPAADRLHRNRGDGTFEDVTARAGMAAPAAPALGAIAADLDGDGWIDLYVANDQAPNRMWLNQGDGTFVDDALVSGNAVNERGAPEASMGVVPADFDGDGRLDLFLTHLRGQTHTLYLGDEGGLYTDATARFGLGAASAGTGFGAGAVDLEHDGYLDLVIVNGAVRTLEPLARAGDPYPLHQPNQLFRNEGGRRLVDLGAAAGEALSRSEVSRGAAFGDLDDDGDVDVVVSNNLGAARVLLSDASDRGPWIGFRVEDRHGARAHATDVTLVAGSGRRLLRRAGPDGSYASANDVRVTFGLSGVDAITHVEVRWPDGTHERFAGKALARQRYHVLRQGSGSKDEAGP